MLSEHLKKHALRVAVEQVLVWPRLNTSPRPFHSCDKSYGAYILCKTLRGSEDTERSSMWSTEPNSGHRHQFRESHK